MPRSEPPSKRAGGDETVRVDASVAIGWVHPGQATPATQRLLASVRQGTLIEAPALWPLEVANVLLVLVRHRKLTEAERLSSLNWLERLAVKIDHEMAHLAFTTVSELASRHSLSSYDAAYLELCLRRGLPLGCKDGPLKEAAGKCGVTVL